MKRMVIGIGIGVAAAAVASTPAVVGLTGNPSFSRQIPVVMPSQARQSTDAVLTTTRVPRRPVPPEGARGQARPADPGGRRTAPAQACLDHNCAEILSDWPLRASRIRSGHRRPKRRDPGRAAGPPGPRGETTCGSARIARGERWRGRAGGA